MNMKALDISMNHTAVQEEKHIDFIQRIKARRQVMKQAAEDLIEELGLPIESKYDIMSIIYTSPSPPPAPAMKKETSQVGQSAGILPAPFAYDDDANEIDFILEREERFILLLARKNIAYTNLPAELVEDEVDELAQRIRIKLWQALQTRHIMSIKPYIRAIAHSEYIRTKQHAYPVLPLTLDQEGELYQGQALLITPSEAMQDPAHQVELQEMVATMIADTASAAMKLPPAQQHAMICALKDQVDDLADLVEAFRGFDVDIEKVQWPESNKEVHRLKASLAVARKKLRSLLK
jgi:hypothetical protein